MSEQVHVPSKPATTPARHLTPVPFGVLQRKCACGGSGSSHGECEECKKKNMTLQRHPAGRAEPATVPTIVHDVLRSPGQPLDAGTRAFFESRFGHDFSKVRLHTDAKAAESARAVNARAYAVGSDIAFSSGEYQPYKAEGLHSLAHELAHVIQQTSGQMSGVPRSIEIGKPDDLAEHEAEEAARQLSGPLTTLPGKDQPRLRRQSSKDDEPKKEPAPVIPLPHPFDRLDIKPIIPGPISAPSLEDINKAWWYLHGMGKSAPANLACAPGWEMRKSGPAEGLCCPSSISDPSHCCAPYRLTSLGGCCPPGQYAQGLKCVKFTYPTIKAPISGKGPAPTTPTPARPFRPVPGRLLIPVPPLTVSMDIFFKQNRPGTVTGSGGALRDSLTPSGASAFESLVAWLKRGQQFSVQLTGKASVEGTSAHNRGLGEHRVRSVALALAGEGIGADRIADPPGLPSPCTKLEDGIRNCGDSLASKTVDARDREVRATLFISSQKP